MIIIVKRGNNQVFYPSIPLVEKLGLCLQCALNIEKQWQDASIDAYNHTPLFGKQQTTTAESLIWVLWGASDRFFNSKISLRRNSSSLSDPRALVQRASYKKKTLTTCWTSKRIQEKKFVTQTSCARNRGRRYFWSE